MGKLFKILIGIFSFIALIMLINVSFFAGEENKQENKIKFNSCSYSGAFINQINFLDNIYTTNKNLYSVSEKGNEINISLKKGVFILDLNDISKNYKINSDKFSLDIQSPGDIFINTSDKQNVIFSINSSFKLNFLDKQNNIINYYFIYPHEYIKFNPELNFIYKKADLYRIRTTTKNGYIKENIKDFIEAEKKKNKLLNRNSILLFNDYILNKKNIFDRNSILYKKLFLLNKIDFPFFDIINKYSSYFINDSKRITFLQNNIYNNLQRFIKEKEIKSNYINNIKKDLLLLKQIDKDSYKNAIEYIKEIYKIYILENNIFDFPKVKQILFLFKDNINLGNKKALIILKNLYFINDFKSLGFSNDKFNYFLDHYLKQLNKNSLEQESFLFYLYEYINNTLFLDPSKISYDTDILKKYILLSQKIYFSNQKIESYKIKTFLVKNKTILEKIEKYLRNNYFKQNRNKYNLLDFKTRDIKLENINYLKKQTDILIKLFISNKNLLDKVNIEEYNNLIKNLKEEYLALQNYEEYTIEYNNILKELYNSSGVGKQKTKNFTKQDIIDYLKQFNSLRFDEDKVEKINDFFRIKEISILGKKFIFDLYPKKGNKLNIFQYNNQDISKNYISYDLDYFEKLLEEKIKGVKQEEKYKYEFKNFFLQKLKNPVFKKQNINIEELCSLRNMIPDYSKPGSCKKKNNDIEAISVFKKNTLLGEEFRILKDFFDIKYDNLNVEYNNDGYNIEIKNTKVSLNIDDKKYNLIFNSNYDFKNHKFYNISFIILDSEKRELFSGAINKIRFKEINIFDLKNSLKDYIKNIEYLRNIYGTLVSKNMNLNNLKIENIYKYNYLEFELNNKKITIKVEKDKILSIIVDNVNILDNSINISDFKNYIDKIK